MVLDILEAVSTSEKFNGKIKKLNTKQQYIEHNKAVYAWWGLICCLLRVATLSQQILQLPSPDPK